MPSTIKQTAFRFSADDLARLEAVRAHTGLTSRTAALRVVLLSYSRAMGLEPAKPKRKSKAE